MRFAWYVDVSFLAGRVCARLDAGKRMIYRFRQGIIGLSAIAWLTIAVIGMETGRSMGTYGELACKGTPENGAAFAFSLPRPSTPH